MRRGTRARLVFAAVVAWWASWPADSYFMPGYLPVVPGAVEIDPDDADDQQGRVPGARGRLRGLRLHPGGKQFAGGRAMATPFGNIYAPNVTADDETGIGRWTADDFYRMMHSGISRDGTLMYPVMPFASYTKVTREDSDAIYAYMMSVPPVSQKNRPHELRFPFNQRDLLIGWRALYFKAGEFGPNQKSAQWNRGAYLVEGLGHCAMCHTAINKLGGSKTSRGVRRRHDPQPELVCAVADVEPRGGPRQLEHQGNHRPALQAGISHRATVYGPMAEVVYNSLQYLSDADVEAMAVYLKELPQRDPGPPPTKQRAAGQPERDGTWPQDLRKQCSMCHGEEGKGHPPQYPPLAGNQSITMSPPGEFDPHGVERRLCTRHQAQPEAARHAALLAHPQ